MRRLEQVVCVMSVVAFAAAGGCGSGDSGTPGDSDAAVSSDAGFGFPTGDGGRPTVTILSPDNGAEFSLGESVVLAGLVGDAEDAPTELTLTWSSDLDGQVATPVANPNGVASVTVDDLSAGTHRLTLRATDSDAGVSEASVDVIVVGEVGDPLVSITPEAPRTDDDLSAAVTLPDGAEGAEVTYRWLRDGLDSGLNGNVAPSQLTERGDEWEVRVTIDIGHGQVSEGSAKVLILNTPPSCDEALMLPSAGVTTDTFECTCSTREDSDPGDDDQDYCVFLIDEVPVEVTGEDSCVLPPLTALRGDFLTCQLIPFDGLDEGEPAVAGPTAILNAPPATPDVLVDPPSGGLGTEFTCLVDGGADPDGDDVTFQYTWSVNGYENAGSTSETVTPGTLASDAIATPPVKGDQLRCSARAFDGTTLSGPGLSQAVVLGNSPPSGGAVLVDPSTATESTVLTCMAADAVDSDGDEIVWFYAWAVNGETVVGQASPTLDGTWFDKGDVVTCIATPSDGELNGAPLSSKNQVIVQNTLPVIEAVTVTPEVASTSEVFTCEWSGWIDPDPADTEPEVTLQWEQMGSDGWAPMEGETGETVAAESLSKGAQVRCVATPHNGAQAGEPVPSNAASVGNSSPTVASVAITPAAGGPCDEYACEASGVVDPDGDDTQVVYRWTLDDVPVGEEKAVLTGVAVSPGDVLHCFAKATDGTFSGDGGLLFGPEIGSVPVVVTNTAPVIPSATLTPAEPLPTSQLTCTAGPLSDADWCQGGFSWWYEWIVGGEVVDMPNTNLLSAVGIAPGTTVQCSVAPSDGWDFGEPALSNEVVILPQEPEVDISAPAGAAGSVECILTQEVSVAGPVTYTFYWSFNGGAEQVLPATLSAESVGDCDVITCRAVATAPGFEAGSNVDTESFPFGSDCNDSQPCTNDSCSPTGGCYHQIHADPCEDGEPCTAGENCAGGICGGGDPVSCDDANDCTSDECVDGLGCSYVVLEGACGVDGLCIDGVCCEPSCDGKGCGGDGCGGSCGECDAPAVCDSEAGLCIGPTEGMNIVDLGAFWMGCNENDDLACKNDEYPFHLVYVDTFEADLYEVTVDDYEECVSTFECGPPGTGPNCNYLELDRGNHPINCVNWYDAEDYCAFAGKRMCTEAEWEMAARGIDARRYPWGFELPDCTLAIGPDDEDVDGCGTNSTWEVGSVPAGVSPYGLHDMAGNVHEWVSDWYSDVTYDGTNDNPTGAEMGNLKVRRGGAFDSSAVDMRTGARHKSSPLFGPPDHGFRCCRTFP